MKPDLTLRANESLLICAADSYLYGNAIKGSPACKPGFFFIVAGSADCTDRPEYCVLKYEQMTEFQHSENILKYALKFLMTLSAMQLAALIRPFFHKPHFLPFDRPIGFK